MTFARAACLLFLSLGLCAFARAAATPGPWVSVQTNALAQWKARHNAPAGVFADKAARRVTFLAEATGLKQGETVEFLAIGPDSDRAYESFCVTVAKPSEIAAALRAVGVPAGRPAVPAQALLWPQGEKVTWTVGGKSIAAYVRDVRDPKGGFPDAIRFTGGLPAADTAAPCACFALYTTAPSAFQLDGRHAQTEVYGRYVAARDVAAGTLLEMTVSWDGVRDVFEKTVAVVPGADAPALLRAVRAEAAGRTAFVRLAFDPSVTLAEAARAAAVFAAADGADLRMNGAADGQFYYGAYLPQAEWRDRAKRIFQPFELRYAPTEKGIGTLTHVVEDWSGEGTDPVLRPKDYALASFDAIPAVLAKLPGETKKVSVLFLYAPAATPVGQLFPAKAAASSRLDTFYLFPME